MKLKQSAVAAAIGLALAGVSLSAQANLTTTTVLSFTPAPGGPDQSAQPALGSGSWFSALIDPENSQYVYTPIESFQGIHIGILQPASGTHSGKPNGTESPSVDIPHYFFGNTGLWQIIGTPVTVLSHSGISATLDFRGWDWPWNGISSIPAYDPAVDSGIATMTCSLASCSNTSSYTLDYTGHTPLSHPSGFGGVEWTTHLEGQVSSTPVPVPATLWLFGSGLAGLAAAAKRRKAKSSRER